MKLTFDSIEEVREFIKGLKGTRGGRNADDGEQATGTAGGAPPPAMPPQGGAAFPGPGTATAQFNPPAGFPGAGTQADPVTAGLVQRIVARIDGAIQSGQPADTVLSWFRSQCGAEAANATMDQIKQVFLPKLAVPSLENIAKLMNA